MSAPRSSPDSATHRRTRREHPKGRGPRASRPNCRTSAREKPRYPSHVMPTRDRETEAVSRTIRAPRPNEPRLRRIGALRLLIGAQTTTFEPPPGTSRLLGGRADAADIVIRDPSVSTRHFELVLREHDIVLRDLASTNGTWIAGARVVEVILVPGATFHAGSVSVTIASADAIEIPRITASSYGPILGADPTMQAVFALVDRLAPTELAVVLEGETGTGKELIARALHQRSARASAPFCVLDCASLPRDLAESAIRGHAAGAFTGAGDARPSVFEDAAGGTLLLDEVGELPLDLQPKLLRVLDTHEVQRLGESRPRPVDVRVVAATHRNLLQMVADGTFREDLYHRLAQFTLEVPPLRDRGADVAELAQCFVEEFSSEHDTPRVLDKGAVARLSSYAWPGNVRELRNTMLRAVQLSRAPTITAADLDFGLAPRRRASSLDAQRGAPVPLEEARREHDRAYVLALLAHTDHNITKAAAIANMSRRAIYDLVERLGISIR